MRVDDGEGCRGRREGVGSVNQGRLRIDVSHWLLECDAWGTKRQSLLQCMRQMINDFDSLGDDDKLICVLDKGCKHASVLKAIMKMWTAQF